MNVHSTMSMSGSVGFKVVMRATKASLWWRLKNLRYLAKAWPGLLAARVANLLGVSTLESALYLQKIDRLTGRIVDYGCVSRRCLTDVGVGYIVDAFANGVELENMKYHGFGTTNTAEAANQTALAAEVTDTYYAANVRPTGTTEEGGAANIFQTVATFSPDSGGSLAIVEHGVFSANAAGVLLDRPMFGVITVVAPTDSLVATYKLTLTAGS